MRQHKCGTCRFYQEARLASSGWCHHPQRKTTNDLMIMVRKNELACRDEWSHDLWEARANQPGTDGAPRTELFPDRKMPPATESEIAALLHAERAPNGGAVSGHNATDDVVLSELGAATERPTFRERPDIVPDWAAPKSRPVESPASPAPISELGTRSAIIRARETYRERSRLEAARANEITRLTAKADLERPASIGAELHPRGPDASQDVDFAVASESLTEPAAPLLAAPADGVPILVAGDASTARPTSSTQDDGRRLHVAAQELSPPAVSSSPGSQALTAQSRDTELTWLDEHPEFDAASELGESQPWPAPEDAELAQAAAGESARYDYDNDASEASSPASDDWSVADFAETEEYEAEQIDGEHWLDDVVVDDDYEEGSTSLPGFDLAAHLPRICRTCRDFRPAENGDRGWCANQWAFTHRRMVDADERTPCDGVLGNWWLPVDEVWSEAADVSSHGQPTPLLDAWLPQPHLKEPTRRRS